MRTSSPGTGRSNQKAISGLEATDAVQKWHFSTRHEARCGGTSRRNGRVRSRMIVPFGTTLYRTSKRFTLAERLSSIFYGTTLKDVRL